MPFLSQKLTPSPVPWTQLTEQKPLGKLLVSNLGFIYWTLSNYIQGKGLRVSRMVIELSQILRLYQFPLFERNSSEFKHQYDILQGRLIPLFFT
jgi:hypothetical protein